MLYTMIHNYCKKGFVDREGDALIFKLIPPAIELFKYLCLTNRYPECPFKYIEDLAKDAIKKGTSIVYYVQENRFDLLDNCVIEEKCEENYVEDCEENLLKGDFEVTCKLPYLSELETRDGRRLVLLNDKTLYSGETNELISIENNYDKNLRHLDLPNLDIVGIYRNGKLVHEINQNNKPIFKVFKSEDGEHWEGVNISREKMDKIMEIIYSE